MQMHLHYMHILSILLDVQAQKKEPSRSPSEGTIRNFLIVAYRMIMHRLESKPLYCGSPWER